ncbi:hypothetical protein ABZ622_41150 [Streptomyces sp. NPDC007164]|uniref:hypothetical protein n=1 Tax=Streptomyces sp. NPDC007164 TaxID=3156918 RepID=UPI0033DA8C08
MKSLREEQIKAVLPAPGDVPAGWEPAGTPRYSGPEPADGLVASASRGYAASDLDGAVGFNVKSFKSPAAAIGHVTQKKKQFGGAEQRPVQFTGVDAAFSASYCMGDSYCSTSINVRVGPAVAFVNINTNVRPAADPRILNPAMRMLVERIRQAQQGQEPKAKAG